MSQPLVALLFAAACTHPPGDAVSKSTDAPTPSLHAGPALVDITMFQVVAVPIVEDGVPWPIGARSAPLVQGRDAVLRATVDAATADIEIQVEITVDGSSQMFKGNPGHDLVHIPAAAIQDDSTFTVSVVDVVSGAVTDRFPDVGSADLGAEVTGPVKVHLVPFEIAGFVPDTSPEVVQGFADAIYAVYPVTDVEVTVGDVVPDAYAGVVDMGTILVDVGIQQETSGAAPDVYYYGLVSGAETREAFCGDCPTGTSESGFGDRARFAVGAAFADQKSEDTLIHELGHLHGLDHAPCGDPSDADLSFPYVDGAIGVEGYDVRTATFVPPGHADLMGYCFPRWISDYNYAKVALWVQNAQAW